MADILPTGHPITCPKVRLRAEIMALSRHQDPDQTLLWILKPSIMDTIIEQYVYITQPYECDIYD